MCQNPREKVKKDMVTNKKREKKGNVVLAWLFSMKLSN